MVFSRTRYGLIFLFCFYKCLKYTPILTGINTANSRHDPAPPRLGPSGLALHYANVINQIDSIVSLNYPEPWMPIPFCAKKEKKLLPLFS